MAWGFVAAGTVATGANPTPALPTGWAPGYLLIIVATSGTVFSATPPTGYTQAARYTTAAPFLTVWYKLAASGETAPSVTNANTNSAAVLLCYSGANVLDVVSAVATASATTVNTPTITTTVANDLVLSIYGGSTGTNATQRTWTAPASTTLRSSQNRTNTQTGFLVVDENKVTAGLTTARTGTTSQTVALNAFAVSFKPAAALTQAVTTTPVTSSITLSDIFSFKRLLSVAQTVSSSFTKTLSDTISLSSNTVNSLQLSGLKNITATVSNSISLLANKLYLKTLIAGTYRVVSGAVNSATVNFNVLNDSVTNVVEGIVSTASITTKAIQGRILSISVTSTSSVFKGLFKTFTVAVDNIPVLIKSLFTSLIATQTNIVTVIKKINLIKSVISTNTVSIFKSILKTLIATETEVVTLLRIINRLVLLTISSTTTNTVFKQVNNTLTALVTNTVSVIRKYLITLIASGHDAIAGTINSAAVNFNALNGFVETLGNGIASTVTLNTRAIQGRILSVISNTTNTLTIFLTLNKVLSILSTSINTLTRSTIYSKVLTVIASSTISLFKLILTTLTAIVSETVTLAFTKLKFQVLIATVTSTVTLVINNFIKKVLTTTVNCGIILSKVINKYLNIVSSVIVILLTNAISFVNYPVDRLVYAADKIREATRVRFDTVIAATEKLRQATVVKFRTVFIDKDTRV